MLRNSISEGRYHDPQSDRKANPQCFSAAHIEHLPLILAGPILRRTESNAVTVWVALKAPREVTLKVYATDAKASPKVAVRATAAANLHSPIVYPPAVINTSRNPAAAKTFVEFLAGDRAKIVFQKYGFGTAR